MIIDLKGTVILITGAGTGLGKEMARALYESGAKIVSISKEYEVVFPKECLAFEHDIFDEKALRSSVLKIKKIFGKIDILINNIGYGSNDICENLTECEFKTMFKLNTIAQLYMLEMLVKDAELQIQQVINISSAYSKTAIPTLGAYAATKCASRQLTKSLAELYPNISFACVSPGYMQHKKHVNYFSGIYGKKFLKYKIPLKRVGDPKKELIPAILILCMPIYRNIKYIDMFIDGGLSAHISMEG